MYPTVYLETTIIGYLAMQPSGVLRIAANQQTTHAWWTGHRHRFSVYVARFVVGESSAGDSAAAAERLRVMIKQHPFCKSRFSKVGHLASMFR